MAPHPDDPLRIVAELDPDATRVLLEQARQARRRWSSRRFAAASLLAGALLALPICLYGVAQRDPAVLVQVCTVGGAATSALLMVVLVYAAFRALFLSDRRLLNSAARVGRQQFWLAGLALCGTPAIAVYALTGATGWLVAGLAVALWACCSMLAAIVLAAWRGEWPIT